MRLLINIDVPDLERAIGFYEQAFGLTLTRRLGPAVAEMSGAQAPSICWKRLPARRQRRDAPAAGLRPALDAGAPGRGGGRRGRGRGAAVAAGARLEDPAATHAWGRIAHLSDPFGHGICLLQFLGRGYDELAEPALRYPAVSEADFEDLLALRIAAMRESLERLGRFDPERARSRLQATFRPEYTWAIELEGKRVGFTPCARMATACAWTTCTCTHRSRPGPGRPHAQAPAGTGRRARPAAARGRPARQRFEPLLPAPRLRPGRRKRMGHRIPAPRAGENRG